MFFGFLWLFGGTSGGTNAKVSEWCTRGLLDREVVMMTPILEMRHTTPMHERRRSLSRPRSLFGGLDNNNNSGGVVHQDDRTARLAGGVVAVQSKSGHAQRALYVVGGTSLLLPLFAQLEPPPAALIGGGGGGEGTVGAADGAADAVGGAKEKSVGGGNEFDEAFELMMFVLTLVMGESGDVLMNEMEQLQTIIPTISVLCKICSVDAVGGIDDATAVIDRSFLLGVAA